jgi:hypothetical protein
MIPGDTAFTRIIASVGRALKVPFVRDARAAGTLLVGWSKRFVILQCARMISTAVGRTGSKKESSFLS